MKIKTAEAAAVMGCSPQFVRVGMQQGKLNIGDVQDSSETDIDGSFGVPKKYVAFLNAYKKARF